MGLFNRSNCDICGEKPGLTGAKKLEDGNMCGKCAKKLSPFTTDRKNTSLADIKEHLAYRESNKPKVAAFKVSRQFGGSTKVLVDNSNGTFIVTSSKRWQDENPDVINIAQVTSCNSDVRETRNEITTTDAQGKKVSYRPPRYEYSYDFYMVIEVNSPYFNEIRFKLNSFSVDRGTGTYRDLESQVYDIQEALKPLRPVAQPAAATISEPHNPPNTNAVPADGPKTCPQCGAAASSGGKFCEFCGAPMQ